MVAQQAAKPDSRPVLEITQSTVLDPAKTYGRIVIKASNITIDGRGAWVIGATQGAPKDYKDVGVSAKGVSKVTLTNLNVKGWQTALKVEDGSGWLIEGCNFSNNFHVPELQWGDYAQSGGIVLTRVTDSTLRKNKANQVWDACQLIESDRNLIEKNDFSNASNTCIRTFTACHNEIKHNNLSHGNRIKPPDVHAYDSAGVLMENGSDNNHFVDNDITYGGDGVFLRPLNGWVSRGNVFEHNDTSFANNNCIESQSPGNIFRHNKANYGSHGIWIGLSDESVIEDNEVSYNGDPVKTRRNAGWPYPNATIEPRGGAGGIIIIGQSNHTVCRGNKCIGNNGAGVVLWGGGQGPRTRLYHWILDNNEIRDNRIGVYLHLVNWIDMGGNVLDNKEHNLLIGDSVTDIIEHVGDPKITAPPRAMLEGPSWAVAGKAAYFNAAKSTDPAGKPLFFRWFLDDGSKPEFQSSVTHAFKEPGFYRVGVTVTNGRFSDLAFRNFRVVDDIPPLGVKGAVGKAADWGFQEVYPQEGLYWSQQSNYIPVGLAPGVPDAKTQVEFSDDKECVLTGATSVRARITTAGNMTSLLYPRTKNLDVSLDGKNYLVFWSKWVNPWGGALLPVIRLHESDQKFAILRPSDDQRHNPMVDERVDWRYRKIPLHPAPDDKLWRLDGQLPAKLNFITIEFSPYGPGPFRVWIDALGVK